jgi:predicted nucleic acid-binding Zn ribbon protein
MESLGHALGRLLKDVGIDRSVKQQTALVLWSEVVGPIIAGVTEAQDVEHGVLTVKTANSTWRQELFFQKKDILKRLNSKLGITIIKDIRFL